MTELSLSSVAKALKEKKKTLILCHKNPDPDTLGSAFALKEILEYLGCEIRVCCCDTPSEKFRFITKNNNFEYDPSESYERIVAVDVGSKVQLGDYDFLADKVDITIDHHEMNTRFSDYYENFSASCCENILALADEMELTDKLPLHFFECIYAGVSGDTGGFKYSNVTPATHETASRLIEKGIDHAEINRIIFDSKTVGEINAQKVTYDKMQFYCNGRLAIVMFTNDMRNKYNISEVDITDIVNYIRCIDGVYVAVSIKQSSKDDKKFSISSRANCDINVSDICSKIGGGGHVRAAGATIVAQSPEQALDTILGVFSDPVAKFGDKQ